jgi:hypothetical protein
VGGGCLTFTCHSSPPPLCLMNLPQWWQSSRPRDAFSREEGGECGEAKRRAESLKRADGRGRGKGKGKGGSSWIWCAVVHKRWVRTAAKGAEKGGRTGGVEAEGSGRAEGQPAAGASRQAGTPAR